MFSALQKIVLAASVVAAASVVSTPQQAEAAYGHRQYYSSWSYSPQRSYYYTSYYYRPSVTYTSYHRHYCIHYPSRPRYVYYYNPTRRTYWGRYDLQEQGYSMLEEKDRKEKLEEIPESAFPEPTKMPVIPESEDGERMKPIDKDTLPKLETPEALPVE